MSYKNHFEIREYVDCSKEEKLECAPIIKEILMLANIACMKGLLALEEKATQSNNPYLIKGILLVVDGTDPEYVNETLCISSVFSFKTGIELLKEMIILEGVLSIQAGHNPRIIEEKLLSFLGDAADEVRKNI